VDFPFAVRLKKTTGAGVSEVAGRSIVLDIVCLVRAELEVENGGMWR